MYVVLIFLTILCLINFFKKKREINLDKLKKKNKQYINYDKVILLIVNCKKYAHKREKQLQSWINDIPKDLKYYHVIGDENLEEDYVFDHLEKIIYVKCKDDYLSLPQKVILSYQAVDENFDYKYIYKTDDDQNIQKEIWELLRSNLNESVNYGGQYCQYKKDIITTPDYSKEHPELPSSFKIEKSIFCGGRFYLLSNKNVKDLLKKKNFFKDRILEDQSVGYIMDDKYKKNGLYFNIDRYFQTEY